MSEDLKETIKVFAILFLLSAILSFGIYKAYLDIKAKQAIIEFNEKAKK
jgi:hypothetical protein